MREDTFKKIVEQTKTSFLQKLTQLYKKSGVYQQSFDIYNDESGEIIGSIKEIDLKSDNFDYYLKNNQFARLIGETITFLKVRKSNGDEYIEDFQNSEWSEEQNFFERYKRAINFLIS
jgi:hypothetical protein